MSWRWHCTICGISCAQGSKESHIAGRKHRQNAACQIGQSPACGALDHLSGNSGEVFSSVSSSKGPSTGSPERQASNVKQELLLQTSYKLVKKSPSASPKNNFSEAFRDAFKRKQGVNLYVKDGKVWWEFSYNPTAILAIKEYIPGRKWNPGPKKMWSNPLESLPQAIELYEFMGRTASDDLKKRAVAIRKACGGGNSSEEISLKVILDKGEGDNNQGGCSQQPSNSFSIGTVEVKFTYNADIVTAIKMLPPNQRSFNGETKVWPIDLLALPDLVELLHPLDYAPCAKVTALCQACRAVSRNMYSETDDDDDNATRLAEFICRPVNEEHNPIVVTPAPKRTNPDGKDNVKHQHRTQLERNIQEIVSLLMRHQNGTGNIVSLDRSDCGQARKRRKLSAAQERWSRKQRGEWNSDDEDDYFGGYSIMYDEFDDDDDDSIWDIKVNASARLAARLTFLSRSKSMEKSNSATACLLPSDCDCGRPDIMSGGTHVCRYFGTYHCGCGNTWTSAYTWKGEKQACRSCNVESRPTKTDKLENGKGGGMAGAHDQGRCSRCRKLGFPCHLSY